VGHVARAWLAVSGARSGAGGASCATAGAAARSSSACRDAVRRLQRSRVTSQGSARSVDVAAPRGLRAWLGPRTAWKPFSERLASSQGGGRDHRVLERGQVRFWTGRFGLQGCPVFGARFARLLAEGGGLSRLRWAPGKQYARVLKESSRECSPSGTVQAVVGVFRSRLYIRSASLHRAAAPHAA
jgi:hypothetical protein